MAVKWNQMKIWGGLKNRGVYAAEMWVCIASRGTYVLPCSSVKQTAKF